MDDREEIENIKNSVENSSEISARDTDLVLEASRKIDLQPGRGDKRHIKILGGMKRLARDAPVELTDCLEERETAEELVAYIHRRYDSSTSRQDLRSDFRCFARLVNDGSLPESVEWISGSKSGNPSGPRPEDMISIEETREIVDATLNLRDAALIAVAWDAGPRSGELYSVNYGDVSDSKHGYQLRVDGKKGERVIKPLVASIEPLSKWLDQHPSKDKNDPLWCRLNDGSSRISKNMFRKVFRESMERAGVDKPDTPTNFRKSSASYLAPRVSQAVLEDHHGWERGSRVASRYVAVFDETSADKIAEAYGVDVGEEELEDNAPIDCPRCGTSNDCTADFCWRCHQVLNPEATESLENKEKQIRKEALEFARKNPEVLDEVEESEEMLLKFERNPELFDEAKRFIEALEDS